MTKLNEGQRVTPPALTCVPGMNAIPAMLLVLSMSPLPIFGQGVISRITLSAPGLDVEIVDENAREDFRVGPGPGNTLNGRPNWQPRSWIVEDWLNPVAEPAPSLRRVRATFSIDRGTGAREYVVFYVHDPVAEHGFVYLPGNGEPFYSQNVNLLYRGDQFEGHWFRATSEWTGQAQAAIERAEN